MIKWLDCYLACSPASHSPGVCVCVSRRTLQLARQLKDRAVEAQACDSLGNTYTLLQDYERAIDYHLKHLLIAQDLEDRYLPQTQCFVVVVSSQRRLSNIVRIYIYKAVIQLMDDMML